MIITYLIFFLLYQSLLLLVSILVVCHHSLPLGVMGQGDVRTGQIDARTGKRELRDREELLTKIRTLDGKEN